ncbi:hypothetical protein ACFL3E_00520 [Patescibacteria group bacterium]
MRTNEFGIIFIGVKGIIRQELKMQKGATGIIIAVILLILIAGGYFYFFTPLYDEITNNIKEIPVMSEPIDNQAIQPIIKDESLAPEEINSIIANAVEWFKNSQEPSGHFNYEYSLVNDEYSNDGNMVRQMGALYELGEILVRDTKNVFNLKNSVKNSIQYARNNSVKRNLNSQQFLCVKKDKSRCSLGAVSLALIGVLDYVSVYPEEQAKYQDLINGYIDFILAMKKPDKGFRANYYLTTNQTNTESSFANGEAFFALVRYYKHNPTNEVKKVIDESFEYFDVIYRNEWDNNFYLWGMAAIKDLYASEPLLEYFEFVRDYTNWRIEGYKGLRKTKHNKCAYIEGVISAYSVIKTHEEEINFWLKKSQELQIMDNKITTSIIEDIEFPLYLKNPDIAKGGFLTGLEYDELLQRIDFTQHCLSAYLQKHVDINSAELR